MSIKLARQRSRYSQLLQELHLSPHFPAYVVLKQEPILIFLIARRYQLWDLEELRYGTA